MKLLFLCFFPSQYRPQIEQVGQLWRLKAQTKRLANEVPFQVMVFTQLRLKVQNSRKTPFQPLHNHFPAQSTDSINFLTLRDEKFEQTTQTKSAWRFCVHAITGIVRSLAAEIDDPP